MDSRRRANPYEIIGKSIFINRAAVKLANLDYLCERLVPPRETEKVVRKSCEFLLIALCSSSFVMYALVQVDLQSMFFGKDAEYTPEDGE